jgi:hypothetical protein
MSIIDGTTLIIRHSVTNDLNFGSCIYMGIVFYNDLLHKNV